MLMTTKTLILESGRCSHSACIFCGYSRLKERPVNAQLLKTRIDRELLEPDFDTLKIFASGSFLDDKQFPREFRKYFAEKCRAKKIKT